MDQSSKLTSPRVQRRLLVLSSLVLAAGIAGVLIVFLRDTGTKLNAPISTIPVDKPTLPKRDKLPAAARLVAGRFVLTAVQRKDLAAAWKLIGPGIRQDLTYREWLTGNIPVVPFLAPISIAPIKVDFSSKNYAILEIILLPKSRRLKSEIFSIELITVGKGAKKHWVVNSWSPRSRPTIPNNPSSS